MEFRVPQRGHDWIMGDPQAGQKFGTSWSISPLGNQLHSAFVHIALAIDISLDLQLSNPIFPRAIRDPRNHHTPPHLTRLVFGGTLRICDHSKRTGVQQNDQAHEKSL